MGNFIWSVALLAFVIIFTAVNSVIICNICDDVISMIDAGLVEDACELWQEKQRYIAFFVRDAEIDVVNAEVKKTEEKIPFEDGEAEADIVSLRDAILEIKHSESITWDSIF